MNETVLLLLKKKNLLLFLCLAFAGYLNAQDIINTTEGKSLNVQILNVGTYDIKYRSNADSLEYTISKSEVVDFKYGMPKDSASAKPDYVPEQKIPKTKSSMYMKGVKDAELYYTKYRAAASGTFWTTLVAGPGPGLIPAFTTSSVSPENQNLGYPDSLLMNNPDYSMGYNTAAKAKKGKKVWNGYLRGVLFNVVFLVVILSSGS